MAHASAQIFWKDQPNLIDVMEMLQEHFAQYLPPSACFQLSYAGAPDTIQAENMGMCLNKVIPTIGACVLASRAQNKTRSHLNARRCRERKLFIPKNALRASLVGRVLSLANPMRKSRFLAITTKKATTAATNLSCSLEKASCRGGGGAFLVQKQTLRSTQRNPF